MDKTIVVDCDGVLANTPLDMVNWFWEMNPGFAGTFIPRDINQWNYTFPDGTTSQQYVQQVLPVRVGEITPIAGAKQGLRALAKAGWTIVVASSRSENLEEATREWLTRNELEFNSVSCGLRDKSQLMGDLLIDDHPGNIYSWVSPRRGAILFRRSWNYYVSMYHGLVLTCMRWDQVPESVEDLYKVQQELVSHEVL